MWKSISLMLKHLLSTGLSIVAVFVSGIACVFTRAAILDRKYYDAELQIYTNNGIATFIGLLVFLIVLLALLYTLQRTLSQTLQWLPYLVAVITCIFASPILVVFLSWN
jgi:hypothetical protein